MDNRLVVHFYQKFRTDFLSNIWTTPKRWGIIMAAREMLGEEVVRA